MVALTASFGKLPQWAQVASILGAVFLAGGGTALATADLTGLAPRVDALETFRVQQDSLHAGIDRTIARIQLDARTDRERIEAKIDRVICLQEAQAGEHGYEQCAR